jgi:hypothetical protein
MEEVMVLFDGQMGGALFSSVQNSEDVEILRSLWWLKGGKAINFLGRFQLTSSLIYFSILSKP